jgi:protein phosphatase
MSQGMQKRLTTPDIFSIDYGIATHPGSRKTNQDVAFAKVHPLPEKGARALFAVADGMGGHPGGAEASRLACELLSYFFVNEMANRKPNSPALMCRCLSDTLYQIDRQIRLTGRKKPDLMHMGTTLSCLAIMKNHSLIAHVGDCRIYRLRRGFLSCLTIDHTFAQDMISDGAADPANAHEHPMRHMLTRTVGTEETLPWVDSRVDSIKIGDRFLLCSDGLYGVVEKTTIGDLLDVQSCAADIAADLIKESLSNGALDNISAIVIKI